jgi:SAM-dependent methyltransferase
MAPVYDAFTAHHDRELWTDMLVELLEPHGLRDRGRLLDVGCGTGKSFVPWQARGWEVVACDASPAMLRIAAEKAAASTATLVADVRELPVLGRFDLVTMTDDVVNYLAPDELPTTFAGVAANLAPGGLFTFDANTLRTYRTFFGETHVCDAEGAFAVWRGAAAPPFDAGDEAEAALDGFVEDEDGRWRRVRSLHRQHHHPIRDLEARLTEAGLEVCAIHGVDDACGHDAVDELRHSKVVVVARRAEG